MIKTLTLFVQENPSIVMCPGHVPKKEFNQAFKKEGWNPAQAYLQKDLRYEYWRKKGKTYYKSAPKKLGAKPVTVANWD